jgi:hypothetical protein
MTAAVSIGPPARVAGCLWLLVALLVGYAAPVSAITMANDPHGFRNLPWGAPLADLPDLAVANAGSRITDYQYRDGPPVYHDIPVESLHLSTVDAQFARVTIRYRGMQTHTQVLQFLEQTYGKIERIPGQMMRGLNQQYTWRGPDTEITLTYEANRDRGYLFIESRTLAPRFQDQISDTPD